jgi:hypothetical protein
MCRQSIGATGASPYRVFPSKRPEDRIRTACSTYAFMTFSASYALNPIVPSDVLQS